MIGDDWFALLTELLDANVRFIVIGAHAMAVHGFPRATQDLDVWIDIERDNAAKTLQALAKFGAPLDALGVTLDRRGDNEQGLLVHQRAVALWPDNPGILCNIAIAMQNLGRYRDALDFVDRALTVPRSG